VREEFAGGGTVVVAGSAIGVGGGGVCEAVCVGVGVNVAVAVGVSDIGGACVKVASGVPISPEG